MTPNSACLSVIDISNVIQILKIHHHPNCNYRFVLPKGRADFAVLKRVFKSDSLDKDEGCHHDKIDYCIYVIHKDKNGKNDIIYYDEIKSATIIDDGTEYLRIVDVLTDTDDKMKIKIIIDTVKVKLASITEKRQYIYNRSEIIA